VGWNVRYNPALPTGGSNPAALDWLARAAGNGVVWAQRFTASADVTKYMNYGGSSIIAQTPYCHFLSSDGVLGDGCLELFQPANDATQPASWGKPFSPIAGVDVNKPGLATMADFSQVVASGIFDDANQGGYFAKTAGAKVIGNEFYLQYRCKYSANRFDAPIITGKNLNIGINKWGTPNQEIVTDCQTDYGGAWFKMYTNGGNAWNTSLTDPQSASGNTNDKIQNQPPYASTCIIGNFPGLSNNCWCYPRNQTWSTIMFHVIPGSQNVGTNLSNPSQPKDQTIEVYVAKAGETTYTKIFSKTDFQFEFDTRGIVQGYNWAAFTSYNGGNQQTAVPQDYWHRYDQIVLSTQFIPCPQY
jgi:hypothetical protein